MNDGVSNGASYGGIKVRTDTTNLSAMVLESFGDGRNLVGEDANQRSSKVASRMGGVK